MVMKGEWYVDSIGDFWYIIREGYKQQKKIGKKGIQGGNYYNKACQEASARNWKMARSKYIYKDKDFIVV